ncbi:hypothetical protein SAMCFNEI73_pB0441 (plasmid) [Sinorhizobium americanum]|uniref:Uncharacterized protein n=1 Tax=Sinorhizobium americanum TaxID=194963 RepID=A0A1L3LU84_9HYPH|nr:hypothetical protein SAMCCGM7_pB0408 [Sinorhizobium americanum CCGM7]APG93637.1 hypothetical protein SAMCFNEI73_pB0441 [Sinorhizobium americanum]
MRWTYTTGWQHFFQGIHRDKPDFPSGTAELKSFADTLRKYQFATADDAIRPQVEQQSR